MKKYVVLALIFILTSCNLYGIPPRRSLGEVEVAFNQEVFDKGGKAYVILNSSNFIKAAGFPVKNYFMFTNERGEDFTIVSSSEPVVFMLSSGTYTLKNFTIFGSRTVGNVTQSINLNLNDEIKGGFTVTAGEVVYLGKAAVKITQVNVSKFAKFMGRGAGAKNISYETSITDDSKSLPIDFLKKVEEQSGKKPVVRLMNFKVR